MKQKKKPNHCFLKRFDDDTNNEDQTTRKKKKQKPFALLTFSHSAFYVCFSHSFISLEQKLSRKFKGHETQTQDQQQQQHSG